MTMLAKGGALLYKLRYYGPNSPLIYNSLGYGSKSEPFTELVKGTLCYSPYSLNNRISNYLGIQMVAVAFKGKFGYIKYIENEWVSVPLSKEVAEIKRRGGWLSRLSMNPETYLPNLDECTGFAAALLDQGVDWSYIEAPITDVVKASIL